jgi:hypothetical protein
MPVKSQAQRRFMYATMEGKTAAPKSVGKEFIQASHGRKNLPERLSALAKKRRDVKGRPI